MALNTPAAIRLLKLINLFYAYGFHNKNIHGLIPKTDIKEYLSYLI